jgi:hypothetical protein
MGRDIGLFETFLPAITDSFILGAGNYSYITGIEVK